MKKLLIIILLFTSTLFCFEELTLESFEEKTIGKNVILDFYTLG